MITGFYDQTFYRASWRWALAHFVVMQSKLGPQIIASTGENRLSIWRIRIFDTEWFWWNCREFINPRIL